MAFQTLKFHYLEIDDSACQKLKIKGLKIQCLCWPMLKIQEFEIILLQIMKYLKIQDVACRIVKIQG